MCSLECLLITCKDKLSSAPATYRQGANGYVLSMGTKIWAPERSPEQGPEQTPEQGPEWKK